MAAQSSKDDWADQWQRIMNSTPDYAYELQSPMLTRLRQTQSGLSRTNSLPTTEGSISRPTPIGLMSTPEAYSSQPAAPTFDPHSHQFAVRALTHEPSLQQSASSSSGGPDRQGSVAEPDADSVGPRPDPTFPQSTPGETDAWTFLHQRQPTADGELEQLEQTQKAGSEFRRISSSIGSQSGHYNPASAIVNRIEHLNERGMKAIIFTIELGQWVAVALLLVLVVTRSYDARREVLRHDSLWAINAAVGFVCIIVLGTNWGILVKRYVHQRGLGKTISGRRWTQLCFSMTESTALLIALALWLGPNMMVLVRKCSWFNPAVPAVEFAMNICWATIFTITVMRARSNNLWLNKRGEPQGGRPDSICADGPFLRMHWMNILLWLALVGTDAMTYASWRRSPTFTSPVLRAAPDCRYSDYDCSPSTFSTVSSALRFCTFCLAVAMFAGFLYRTLRQLRNRPYRDYQMANMSARLMIRTRGTAMLVSVLVKVLYCFVEYSSCSSVLAVRMGPAPLFLMWAAIETTTLYWSMPSPVDENGQILQVWLQEFAWSEEELLPKIKTRGSSLPDAHNINQEPMFCYETALKAYYFAHLMYSYQTVINDAFMLKQTLPSAPDPDDGHHEQHPMSWSKSANVNGELEEVGLCQYRTTEEAKACRKRGPSMAYCNRMPSCKRKGSVQHARAASGKPPKGKEQEAGGVPMHDQQHARRKDPSKTKHSRQKVLCSPAGPVQSSKWSTEHSVHTPGQRDQENLQTAGLRVPTFQQHIGGCADGACCCGPAPKDALAAHRPQHSQAPAQAPLAAGQPQSMSRGSTESGDPLGDIEEGRLSSHGRAQPSGRGEQGALTLALSRLAAVWPLSQLLPQSLVESAAANEACALGEADPQEPPGPEGDPPEGGSGRAARREARHARRDKRISEAAAAISRPDFDLDSAMAMYNLQHVEAFWERKHDTHALLAWGGDRIVLVFRGTASFANVLADLAAWQVTHQPARGSYLMGTKPAVHRGFQQSWQASDLSKRITQRVLEVVKARYEADKSLLKCKILITGHSLGGALATLAAYDIQAAAEAQCPIKVHCMVYSFGAPRVGNHAFARDYRRMIPHTWCIINDQDAVARQAKFLLWYKRAGQRVLINADGDMLVRPTFVEMSIHNRLYGGSVRQHFLLSYRSSLAAVARAQLDRKKRLHGGLHGVRRVLEKQGARTVLEPAGIMLDEIVKAHRWGMARVQPTSDDRIDSSFRVRAPVLARAKQLDTGAAAAAVADADALQAARSLAAHSQQLYETSRHGTGIAAGAQNGEQPPHLHQNGEQHAEAGSGASEQDEDEEDDVVYGGIFEGRCSRMGLGSARKSHTGSSRARSEQEAEPASRADSNV